MGVSNKSGQICMGNCKVMAKILGLLSPPNQKFLDKNSSYYTVKPPY